MNSNQSDNEVKSPVKETQHNHNNNNNNNQEGFKVPDRKTIPPLMTLTEIMDIFPYLRQYEFNEHNCAALIDIIDTLQFNYAELSSKFEALQEDFKKLGDNYEESKEYAKTLQSQIDKDMDARINREKEIAICKNYIENLRDRYLAKVMKDFEKGFQLMKDSDVEVSLLRQEFTYRKEPDNKDHVNNQPKHKQTI